MALAGFLSSFATPIWNTIKPVLGAAGRSIASTFLGQAAQKTTNYLADKGISVDRNYIERINNNSKRGRMNNQKMKDLIQKPPQEEQQQQQVIQIKTKPIKKPVLLTSRPGGRYLRKR